ncbi:hypothetical protein [Pleionea sp. CnH1-48]|uniref:hypothetical protein n=1 Tax=Pleionea sp. CnH1-48 TaxID=2954494 RepID=UPI002097BFFE|nr:hypothetical protein [Pleionea sp. CnH1-48]MCO7225909.1 hypothetical protein [Pleionea sp. CnH1-48]
MNTVKARALSDFKGLYCDANDCMSEEGGEPSHTTFYSYYTGTGFNKGYVVMAYTKNRQAYIQNSLFVSPQSRTYFSQMQTLRDQVKAMRADINDSLAQITGYTAEKAKLKFDNYQPVVNGSCGDLNNDYSSPFDYFRSVVGGQIDSDMLARANAHQPGIDSSVQGITAGIGVPLGGSLGVNIVFNEEAGTATAYFGNGGRLIFDLVRSQPRGGFVPVLNYGLSTVGAGAHPNPSANIPLSRFFTSQGGRTVPNNTSNIITDPCVLKDLEDAIKALGFEVSFGDHQSAFGAGNGWQGCHGQTFLDTTNTYIWYSYDMETRVTTGDDGNPHYTFTLVRREHTLQVPAGTESNPQCDG